MQIKNYIFHNITRRRPPIHVIGGNDRGNVLGEISVSRSGILEVRMTLLQGDVLPVTVRVLNMNDNNPEFSLPEYEFTCYNERFSTVGGLRVRYTRQ